MGLLFGFWYLAIERAVLLSIIIKTNTNQQNLMLIILCVFV